MKKIVLVLLMFINLFAIQKNFLEPEEAFKSQYKEYKDKVEFNLKVAKDIYLYDNKIKVYINKPKKIDITKYIKKEKPKPYHEFMVHFDKLDLTIPKELLKSHLDSNTVELMVKFQGCSTAGLCYAPIKKKININLTDAQSNVAKNDKVENTNLNETDTITNTLKNSSIWVILITFFGFGLLLALTPCVFPMIPILSSIIVKAGTNEKMSASKGFFLSLIYVLSMSLAYTIAGVIAGLFGANLQVALQNPYVLVVFALIFVALAFSMFGYYQIELPKSIQDRINKKTDGKENQGITGIAVMGFLSALIVGPCVAPPLAGALVYIGQTGNALLGGIALFVMSLGMGVPLLLIGLGAGKFMPKPGGWMESITKIFGIVMLGVAIWLLDRVLNPSVTMVLWSLLFIGASIYLKIYSHLLVKLISKVLYILGIILLVGAVSKATNPLNPLEKFTSTKTSVNDSLKFKTIKNLEELKEEIAKSNKPVMLDFSATWCVACKELEHITFKDREVKARLKSFTLLKADVSQNSDEDKALQKEFGIVGPPALIFFDKNNKEIKASRIVGFKNPTDFLAIINKYFKI